MAYFDKYGVEFSDDRKTLVRCPEEFNGGYIVPDGVEYIGADAFRQCEGLKSIIISDGVIKIADCAFWGCKKLSSIIIPDSVKKISDNAFSNCDELPIIDYLCYADSYLVGERCNIYEFDKWPSHLDIKKGTRFIGEGAFRMSNLSSINLPEGVTNISSHMFDSCKKLESIKLPESISSIGKFAFRDCKKLTVVTIPCGVVSVGAYAFLGCDNLKEIIVQNGGKSRFAKMEGLKEFTDIIREDGCLEGKDKSNKVYHRPYSVQEIEDMKYYEAEARFIEENYGVDIRDSIA